jgi:hypothetical protein
LSTLILAACGSGSSDTDSGVSAGPDAGDGGIAIVTGKDGGGADASVGQYYCKVTGGYTGTFASKSPTIIQNDKGWFLGVGNGSSDPADISVIVAFSAAPDTATTYTLSNVQSADLTVRNKHSANLGTWEGGIAQGKGSMILNFTAAGVYPAETHGTVTGTLKPDAMNGADEMADVELEIKF